MPKIIIDDREIEVAPGTKVIEAAERLGIMIPRFCYHPALGSVGACRVCAVKFLQGPFKGVQMSCMIDAKDGMVVSTTDEEAVDFRRHVIEWLMMNHPHDCPVCDEGGHCLLQDMTVSGGHGIRRYPGTKRTYPDQYLGPLIQHEMNRCIHCYRCSRFYQQFSGYRDLGVMQIGNRTYFGRFEDGVLQSPFSGNLSDICPTGVYTDKPSRFFGRRWDYQRSPSLCLHCSLGCQLLTSARYRRVVRQEARFSEAVNGYFICDRGRYGFFYASHETRPRSAKIEAVEATYDKALRVAREKLLKIGKSHGPGAIACVGSGRCSLETLAMLKRLCRTRGWDDPVYFMEPSAARNVRTAVSRLETNLMVSLREMEESDTILVVGADPINEAPMSALAMRQAQRNGAAVIVLDPRPVSLPFDFLHLAVKPDDLTLYLGWLLKGTVGRQASEALGKPASEFYDAIPTENGLTTASQREKLERAAQWMRQARRPVIVCGTDVPDEGPLHLSADFAIFLNVMDKKSGLFYLLPAANAFGAGMISDANDSLTEIIAGIEKGITKALVLVESDPFRHFPDRLRLEQALRKLDLLVVLDYVESPAVQMAQVFLPTATIYEAGGAFINQEGRMQVAEPVYPGGTPVDQVSGGSHPPRIYGAGLPGADSWAAWLILEELATGESLLDEAAARSKLWNELSELNSSLAKLPPIDEFPENGLRLNPGENHNLRFKADWAEKREKSRSRDNTLELVTVDWTFGTEALSSLSACLVPLEREPCLFMHRRDAERFGLRKGDRVAIQSDEGNLEVALCLADNMAAGTVVLPRHRRLEWQRLGGRRIKLAENQIRKAD